MYILRVPELEGYQHKGCILCQAEDSACARLQNHNLGSTKYVKLGGVLMERHKFRMTVQVSVWFLEEMWEPVCTLPFL